MWQCIDKGVHRLYVGRRETPSLYIGYMAGRSNVSVAERDGRTPHARARCFQAASPCLLVVYLDGSNCQCEALPCILLCKLWHVVVIVVLREVIVW